MAKYKDSLAPGVLPLIVIVALAVGFVTASELAKRNKQAAIPAAKQSEQAASDYKEVNPSNPGQELDVTQHIAKGKITIVDFWSPFCPPCVAMRALLKELAAQRPDIAIRSVNVNRPDVKSIDFDSPLAQKYGLNSLPSFQIYGADGKLLATGDEAADQVMICLNRDLKK